MRPRPKGAASLIRTLEQRQGPLDGFVYRQLVFGPARPLARLDHALGQAASADDDAQRATEQLGVGQLLAGAGVAVVVEDLRPTLAQGLVEAVGGLALGLACLGEGNELNLPRCQARGPDDAALVGSLLDRRGDDPCRA